jgi:hypothetical protein
MGLYESGIKMEIEEDLNVWIRFIWLRIGVSGVIL